MRQTLSKSKNCLSVLKNYDGFLKVDGENKGEFEKYGSKPFRPQGHPGVSMSYYEAPAEIFEDPDAMRYWVGGAVSAGRRAAATKPPRKRKL